MKLKGYQAVLVMIVAVLAAFSISTVSYAAKVKAPSYKPAQIEQIQRYIPPVVEMQERITELAKLIDAEKWVNVRTYIHGPLGELRVRTGRVVRSLIGPDQKAAKQIEDALFEHLVDIDVAAEKQDYELALKGYNAAVADLNKLLSLVPQAS